MIRILSILAVVFGAAATHASLNTPNHLALGLGISIPRGSLDAAYLDKAGPSRMTNGETVTITFAKAKTISAIRLTAYSGSRAGAVLIRDARGILTEANKTIETTLVDLIAPNKTPGNGCRNHNGFCMLPDASSNWTMPNDRYTQVVFRLEGFQNADSSILIEMDSAEGIAYQEFILKRNGDSANDGLLGGFIDEKDYANLSTREIRTLMRFAAQPTIPQLANNTYVCTNFAKNSKPKVDFKTRRYFSPGSGILQSTTDRDPAMVTWILTQEGWKMPFNVKTGCGNIVHNVVLRLTSTGNLISEIVLDREEYLRACVNMGYNYNSALQGLEQGTYTSLISPRYRAGAYEFCRPARIP